MDRTHDLANHANAHPQPPPNRSIASVPDPSGTLQRLQVLSRFLDSSFRFPGTSLRFGLDPVIGLVPGVGDAIGFGLSLYPVIEAYRLRVRKRTLGRMVTNVCVDGVVGAIPIVGDVFDFAFKSNQRNVRILRRELMRHTAHKPTAARRVQ
jgi:hypothetical protein